MCTFEGYVFLLDPSNPSIILWTNKKTKSYQKIAATCSDYNRELQILVIGSSDGIIQFMDIAARETLGYVPAFKEKVSCVHIYPQQSQVVSASLHKVVKIWNISNLECIQIIGEPSHSLSISLFDIDKGLLITYSSCLELWEEFSEPSNELMYNKNEYEAHMLKEEPLCQVVQHANRLMNPNKEVTSHIEKNQRIKDIKKIYNSTIRSKRLQVKASYCREGSVLVGKHANLVALLEVVGKDELLSIDTDNIVRIWSVITGISKQSYTILIE